MKSIRSYQRRIKYLLDLMEQMQWVQPMYNGAPSCSLCGEMQHWEDHECELTRLMKREKRA